MDNEIKFGKIPFETWVEDVKSKNTYHLGGGTSFSATDTMDLGRLSRITKTTFYSTSNKSVSPTYIFYASVNNSTWVQLGSISHGGGSFEIEIKDKTLYRYVKVYQSTSQWRRSSDGNEVCSIEPWKVYYKYKVD